MASLNKVEIIGNLGANPELRTMPDGTRVAQISVATSDVWTDKNTNERHERTEWHRIVFFRRQAEIVGEFLRKGSKVFIEGRLRTRTWKDQNEIDRYITEIIGQRIIILDRLNQNNTQSSAINNSTSQNKENVDFINTEDLSDLDKEIPF